MLDQGLTAVWRDRRAWALFVTALALRLGCVALLSNFDTVKGYEAATVAENLLAGKGFVYGFRGPEAPTSVASLPYTLLLAACFALFGKGFVVVEVVQAVVGAAVVFPLFSLGRGMLGDGVGLAAALLGAVYPVHVYYVCRVQQVTLELVLLAMWLALLYSILAAPGRCRAIALGVAGALFLLSRAQYFPYMAGVFGWAGWWTRRRADGPRARRALLLAVVVTGLLLLPWAARNAAVHGSFSPGSAYGWYQFWVGNNPHATGGVWAADGKPVDHPDHIPDAAEAALRRAPSEGERMLVYRALALEHLRADPWSFVRLIPARVLYFWWFDPYLPTDFGFVRRVLYAPVLALFAAGAFMLRARWRELLPLYGLLAYATVLYAAFFSTARFRYILEPAMFLFVAHAAVELYRRASRRRAGTT